MFPYAISENIIMGISRHGRVLRGGSCGLHRFACSPAEVQRGHWRAISRCRQSTRCCRQGGALGSAVQTSDKSSISAAGAAEPVSPIKQCPNVLRSAAGHNSRALLWDGQKCRHGKHSGTASCTSPGITGKSQLRPLATCACGASTGIPRTRRENWLPS